MGKKTKDIAMCVCCLMVTSVFAFGVIAWPEFPEDGTWVGNLYYVTTSSVLYALSVIVFISANSFWWKVGSVIGMSVFATNLYVELYLDQKNWTNWDGTLIIVVSLNTLLVMFITEKLKSWQKRK